MTGASRGMGADTALRLAEDGFDVALTARDQRRLEAVAREITAMGREALPWAADLTDRGSVAAFADAAETWGGGCDVLCNIGIYQGPGAQRLLHEMPTEELALTLEADVVAPALLMQRALKAMIPRRHGVIINMSSAVVVLEPPGPVGENGWSVAYAASKAAIDQFSKVLNVEVGQHGIRVFTVEPGYVAYGDAYEALLRDSPGTPVSPPEAIGPAMAWLVEAPEATKLLSKRINLPALTRDHQLLPGWAGPGTRLGPPTQPRRSGMRSDRR